MSELFNITRHQSFHLLHRVYYPNIVIAWDSNGGLFYFAYTGSNVTLPMKCETLQMEMKNLGRTKENKLD